MKSKKSQPVSKCRTTCSIFILISMILEYHLSFLVTIQRRPTSRPILPSHKHACDISNVFIMTA